MTINAARHAEQGDITISRAPPLRGVRVLLVNDEVGARNRLAVILAAHGALVTALASRHEALSVLRWSTPDVLLCDLELADDEAYVLLTQVRGLERKRGRRVAALGLTCALHSPDAERAVGAGFQRCLPRSVEPAVLAEAVADLAAADERRRPHCAATAEYTVYEAIEPIVRSVVTDGLGIDSDTLARDTSLADDLAMDSLDLLTLAVDLEAAFGITLPTRIRDSVRTYGQLVEAVAGLVARESPPAERKPAWAIVRSQVFAPRERNQWSAGLVRAGPLTGYTAELIAEDALRAGEGARLELEVGSGADEISLAAVGAQFTRLAARGIEVTVRRGGPNGTCPAERGAAARK